MKLKASEAQTIDHINQLSKSEQTAADINEAKAEIDRALKESNAITTSIDKILECVKNMKDKDTKQGVFDRFIPYGVYDSGATTSWV